MKFLVFHLQGSWLSHRPSRFTTDNYTLVAVVEAPAPTDEIEGLDRVFTLTNNIDRPWMDNPEVCHLGAQASRSTSVGDIITTESGDAYRCERAGWTKIDSLEVTKARPFVAHLKHGDLETLILGKWNENERARDRLVAAGLLQELGAYENRFRYERTTSARELGYWQRGEWVYWPFGRALARLIAEAERDQGAA